MPSAEFSDQLLRLQALFSARSSAYGSWLLKLEDRASQDPRLAFELGKWEIAALGPQKAVGWLEGIPKSVRDKPLIGVLMADCYSALNRWADLEYLVRWTSWRELEPLRLAFLARAQAGQGHVQKSEPTWQLALAAAERQPAQLLPFLAMAKAENAMFVRRSGCSQRRIPRQAWARKELYETYLKKRTPTRCFA